jgi:hypothetical protein
MNTHHYIDLHDLPTEQVGVVYAFVDFLRSHGSSERIPAIEWSDEPTNNTAAYVDGEKDPVYGDWHE